MLLFIMTCVTCGALLGMVTYAVLGPILITLALIVTLTCLWVGGALDGTQLITWICLGATAHQLAFLVMVIGRHWAGDALSEAHVGPEDEIAQGAAAAADRSVDDPVLDPTLHPAPQ